MSKIKIRIHKGDNPCQCISCGKTKEEVLNMFDLKLATNVINYICDKCIEDLLKCSLKASCYVDHRKKDQKDIRIINSRNKGSK